jgi:hypothetical protein
VASVSANVVLATFAALHVFRTPDQAGVAPPARELPVAVNSPVRPGNEDPAQEKMLTLAQLEADARAKTPPPQVDFWTPAGDAALESYRRRVESDQDSIRLALKKKYGENAEDDPLFARVFRPLDSRYPYLSSRSQLALLKLQRTRMSDPVTRIALRPEGSGPVPGPAPDEHFNSRVREVLTKAEYDAYELRDSPTARQLRASGLISSEEEFRSAIRILNETDITRGPAAYLESQRTLANLLGQERFLRFSASRDPAYQAVRDAASAQGLQEARTFEVYGAIKDAQLSLLEAQSAAGVDRAPAGMQVRDITMRRDAKVASLVGSDAAGKILQAYSSKLMSMSQRKDLGAL